MINTNDGEQKTDQPAKSQRYMTVRKVGSSYVVSVGRMCREIGAVEGMTVKVTLERVDRWWNISCSSDCWPY